MLNELLEVLLGLVNCICHLDWITVCPDTWSEVILSVVYDCFWMSLTFDSEDSKAGCLP